MSELNFAGDWSKVLWSTSSPNEGEPTCLCSYCGAMIPEDTIALRCWKREGPTRAPRVISASGKSRTYRETLAAGAVAWPRSGEIDEIRRTRTLWIQQLTFGQRFHPIALSIARPEDLP